METILPWIQLTASEAIEWAGICVRSSGLAAEPAEQLLDRMAPAAGLFFLQESLFRERLQASVWLKSPVPYNV